MPPAARRYPPLPLPPMASRACSSVAMPAPNASPVRKASALPLLPPPGKRALPLEGEAAEEDSAAAIPRPNDEVAGGMVRGWWLCVCVAFWLIGK